MTFTRFATAALAACLPALAAAQGFSGAELSVETGLSSDGGDIGTAIYGASLEFGLMQRIAVAADLSHIGFGAFGSDARNATLRGIYQLGDGVALGFFAGQERLDSFDATFYGLEGATDLGAGRIEGYLMQSQGGASDGHIIGVSGAYDFSASLSAIGSLDVAEMDTSARRISVGGEYRLPGGPAVFAEIGQEDADGDAEIFLSLGARIGIGMQGGTTFGRRSIADLLPGY